MVSFDIAFTEYALVVADYLTKRAASYNQAIDPNETGAKDHRPGSGRKAANYLEVSVQAEENVEE